MFVRITSLFVFFAMLVSLPLLTCAEPIPEDVLKCIGFLTVPIPPNDKDATVRTKTIGTAFFVSFSYQQDNTLRYAFLVTAKHVLYDENGAKRDKIFLRMNDRNTKKPRDYNIINNNNWFFHPDNSVDLAIQPLLPRDAEFLFVANNMFVTDDLISKNKIGIGDEVFYVGLLDYFSGVDHIIPIARFGRIALVTDEKTADGMSYYFIDSGNIPGHSGSPVFLWATPTRYSSGIVAGPRIYGLYGVVSALIQYPSPIKIIMPAKTQSAPIPISFSSGGVTAIVPVRFLNELLNDQKVISALGLKK